MRRFAAWRRKSIGNSCERHIAMNVILDYRSSQLSNFSLNATNFDIPRYTMRLTPSHPSMSSQMLSSFILFPVGPCFDLSPAPKFFHCFCELKQIEINAPRIPTVVISRRSCRGREIYFNSKRRLDPCCFASK